VVRILIESSPGLLASVCERLFLERQAHDRKKLLHLLGTNGSEAALKLLAHAVRSCGPGVAPEALQALGRFPHPLALEVLREVVERNNRDDLDLEEVEAAIHSIHALGIKEAHAFLWEIVQSRRSLFSYAYVRPVRVTAERVLQGGVRR
jgi:HEAT repeat protein